MLQKPENISQEQFLKDAQSLSVRFPVATIAEATGFSKANVSRYLSGKQMPSVNFLKAFYKWLSESNKKVTGATNGITPPIFKLDSEVVQAASIKVLFQEMAKVKARLFNMKVEDCLSELQQNTSLVISDILREIKENES